LDALATANGSVGEWLPPLVSPTQAHEATLKPLVKIRVIWYPNFRLITSCDLVSDFRVISWIVLICLDNLNAKIASQTQTRHSSEVLVPNPMFTLVLERLLYLFLSLFLFGSTVPNNQAVGPGAATATSQSSQPRRSDRIDRPTSDPYKGSLSIFEDPKRAERLQVERVMDILGIKEGSNVADIGAGSGWFTVRAAKRVATGGTVFAVEINKEYLQHIEKRSQAENLPNIRTILGKEDDPLLPEKSVDAVLLLKTYHEVKEPIRLLRKTIVAMRPGARLGIIDRNGKGDDHGIDRDTVVQEAERAGLVLVEEHDFVKADNVDYFLVFRVR
jgi:SAM-dependent methyltransferase